MRRRRALLLVACAALGGARLAAHEHVRTRPHPAATPPRLVALVGTVLDAPRLAGPPEGVLAPLERRPPATFVPLRVRTVLDDEGRPHARRATVLVRATGGLPPLAPGDRVRVTGWLDVDRVAGGPGRTPRAWRRSRGTAWTVRVPAPGAVRVLDSPGPSLLEHARAGRARVRRHVERRLLDDLPPARDDAIRRGREATLAALVLGAPRPDPAIDAMRRIGLAHLLAVSGLHLGLLAGAVEAVLRLLRVPPRVRGAILLAVLAGYLAIVAWRVPVLRAAGLAGAWALGRTLGRRWTIEGLTAATAIALLVADPAHLFDPGFQLSYGVVLALVLVVPRVRAVHGPAPDPHASTWPRAIAERGLDLVAVTVVAWAVATPVVALHFGRIAPLGVPLGLAALPLAALVLGLGLVATALALAAPALDGGLDVPLALAADALVRASLAIDRWPLASLAVPVPDPAPVAIAWAVATTAAAVALLVDGLPRRRRPSRIAFVLLCAAPPLAHGLLARAMPGGAMSRGTVLELVTLPVGDGTSHLVRSDGRAVLVDAGAAGGALDAHARSIAPALRDLGVRRLDALVLTHPDLDHDGGAADLLGAITVGELLVTARFHRRADEDPTGVTATILRTARIRGVPVRTVHAGRTRRLGRAALRWHMPAAADAGRAEHVDNDVSMSIEIAAAGRRVLLTGDLETNGAHRLLERLDAASPDDGPRPVDVLELPHHGAHQDATRTLVRALDPGLLIQSAGRRRLDPDPWAGAFPGRVRHVTARDGACRLVIDRRGRLQRRRPP